MDGETMTEWRREGEMDGMNIDNWGLRLFKFGEINKPNSPFGFLPKFRFWMMDPNGMGLLGYSKPAADGSSRELLNYKTQFLSSFVIVLMYVLSLFTTIPSV